MPNHRLIGKIAIPDTFTDTLCKYITLCAAFYNTECIESHIITDPVLSISAYIDALADIQNSHGERSQLLPVM